MCYLAWMRRRKKRRKTTVEKTNHGEDDSLMSRIIFTFWMITVPISVKFSTLYSRKPFKFFLEGAIGVR